MSESFDTLCREYNSHKQEIWREKIIREEGLPMDNFPGRDTLSSTSS